MRPANARIDQRLPVDFLVSVVGREGLAVGRARDLSSGGVLLQRGFDEFPPQEEFELTLHLPQAEGPASCRGTVVYERGVVAGFYFTQVEPHEQRQIDSFIARRRRTAADDGDRGGSSEP